MINKSYQKFLDLINYFFYCKIDLVFMPQWNQKTTAGYLSRMFAGPLFEHAASQR